MSGIHEHGQAGIGLSGCELGQGRRSWIPVLPLCIKPGEKTILVDDLIATGGTAEAAVKLLKEIGADVIAAVFVIDLPDLGGSKKLEKLGVPVRTLVEFSGH